MAGGDRIPVVVVAGFLGSGKTTFLNHLLTHNRGTRIGVLVNDFGSIPVDAMAVAGQVDSMVSLGNGCLCCAVDTSDLDEMLGRLARPGGPVDVVVIEASGLAEPQTMVRMVLSSENEHIAYGGLVQVVDAAEFEASRARHPRLDKHLAIADLVLLNKTDRVDEAERARLVELVKQLSGGSPVVCTEHGRVDPGLLFERRAQPLGVPRQLSFDDLADDDHAEHVHTAYDSVEFRTDQPLNPRRLMRFLDERPAGLYRMKGHAYFGIPRHGQKFGLHAVGRFLRFERSGWARGEARGTGLVLIGAGVDADRVRADLAACVEPDPRTVDPQDMLSVTRYLRTS